VESERPSDGPCDGRKSELTLRSRGRGGKNRTETPNEERTIFSDAVGYGKVSVIGRHGKSSTETPGRGRRGSEQVGKADGTSDEGRDRKPEEDRRTKPVYKRELGGHQARVR